MDVLLVLVGLLVSTATNLHSTGLVVGAVGAGDKLTVGVVAGEPALNYQQSEKRHTSRSYFLAAALFNSPLTMLTTW